MSSSSKGFNFRTVEPVRLGDTERSEGPALAARGTNGGIGLLLSWIFFVNLGDAGALDAFEIKSPVRFGDGGFDDKDNRFVGLFGGVTAPPEGEDTPDVAQVPLGGGSGGCDFSGGRTEITHSIASITRNGRLWGDPGRLWGTITGGSSGGEAPIGVLVEGRGGKFFCVGTAMGTVCRSR